MQGSWSHEYTVEAPQRLQFQMISFNLDPQWCGLLFSICCRHEKVGILGPDAFSVCGLASPPLDADWIAFSGSLGFEVCRLTSSWALIVDTVKTSSIILLFGVGGFICYKLYHHCWPGSRSQLSSPKSPPPPDSGKSGSFLIYNISNEKRLVEDLEDEDFNTIEVQYFGPGQPPKSKLAPQEIDVAKVLERVKAFQDCRPSSHPECATSCEEEPDEELSPLFSRSPCRHAPQFDRVTKSCQSYTKGRFSKEKNSSWLMKRIKSVLPRSTHEMPPEVGTRSLPDTPGRNYRRKRKTWRIAPTGDESYKSAFGRKSYTSPVNVTPHTSQDGTRECVGISKLFRDGSFESTCSEPSVDISFLEASINSSTMACLENLQEEIDQLKNHCLLMDEEFETIKCNRIFPGMSSLMRAGASNNNNTVNADECTQDALKDDFKNENARACFTGLYSLTTIKNSTSSDISDSFAANGRASVCSAESLVWDSPISVASPVKSDENTDRRGKMSLSDISEFNFHDDQYSQGKDYTGNYESTTHNCKANLFPSEHELMANLEWDEECMEENVYFVEEDGKGKRRMFSVQSPSDTSLEFIGALEPPIQQDVMEIKMTNSTLTERSFCSDESVFEDKFTDSSKISLQRQSNCESLASSWDHWSSQESGYLEWDIKNESNYNPPRSGKSSINNILLSEAKCHEMTNLSPVENIGRKINVLEYADQQRTHRAENISKGYYEIPPRLGLKYLRRIRADTYCAIRATIFQVLLNGHPLPDSNNAFRYLSQEFYSECSNWLQNWTFAGGLMYEGSNVLHGMRSCLESLDRVAAVLSSNKSREETLVSLLNNDVNLDVHIMEGVKLLMLKSSMELHNNSCSGIDVPVLAALMFAHGISETPSILMHNHLKEVGRCVDLEQANLFLLGYSLQVTLKVLRPSAYGTEEFVRCYPDLNVGVWPEVVLVAENDRNFSVLVN